MAEPISVRVCGDPALPPVVLLHGWGGSIASMTGLQDRLAPLGYWVHALDLPGFGEEALPPSAWGVPEYAEWVLAYLDSARLARASLIGHSFGGRISLVLGSEQPERIEKIVLTASAGVRTPPTGRQKARQVVYRIVRRTLTGVGLKGLSDGLQHWYWNRYASDDYKNAGPLRDTFARVVQQDLTPYAARIKASTLLIWGDQDTETPLWQGQTLEKLIPDAGLVVFKGAGHFAFQERLGDFVRIVHTFFKG